jgi:hypothetical protein
MGYVVVQTLAGEASTGTVCLDWLPDPDLGPPSRTLFSANRAVEAL